MELCISAVIKDEARKQTWPTLSCPVVIILCTQLHVFEEKNFAKQHFLKGSFTVGSFYWLTENKAWGNVHAALRTTSSSVPRQHPNFDKTKLRCHVCCDGLSSSGLSKACVCFLRLYMNESRFQQCWVCGRNNVERSRNRHDWHKCISVSLWWKDRAPPRWALILMQQKKKKKAILLMLGPICARGKGEAFSAMWAKSRPWIRIHIQYSCYDHLSLHAAHIALPSPLFLCSLCLSQCQGVCPSQVM